MRKWLAFLALLALLAATAWHYRERFVDSGTEFVTTPVSRGDVTQAVTATGTLNPVVNVQVGSQISGNIQKLTVDYNSPVKAGQVVAQIDPAVYQAVVLQAEGDLASAKASLELAQINARRAEELRSRNVNAPADLDQAVATLHQAEATVKIKEGALARARVDLDHCTILSPVDGIVISRSVDVGQTVAASLSAPVIFTIANDLANMQIDANVAEADVGNVENGQEVSFTVDAFPQRVFQGRVVQVRNAPITVQNVVTYDTVIGVNNADLKLKPGMTANVAIQIAHRNVVLKLSNSALRFRLPEELLPTPQQVATGIPADTGVPPGGAPTPGATVDAERGQGRSGERRARPGSGGRRPATRTVYLLTDSSDGRRGTPRPVPIKLGISDGVSTEVSEGLKEGDRVITAIASGSPGNSAANRPPGANNPFSGGRRF
jgi:HlyD family secretion protein